MNGALVSRAKIIFPLLHIKHSLMKQFVKALSKEGECFRYLRSSFVVLSEEKLKAGILDGPQIRPLINDEDFMIQCQSQKSAHGEHLLMLYAISLGVKKLRTMKSWCRGFSAHTNNLDAT